MGQTYRETDGRIAALFNSSLVGHNNDWLELICVCRSVACVQLMLLILISRQPQPVVRIKTRLTALLPSQPTTQPSCVFSAGDKCTSQ